MASPTAPVKHLARLVDALALKIFNLCLEAYEVIIADEPAFAGSKKLFVSLVIRIVLQSLPEDCWMHSDYIAFLTQASFYWEEKLIKKFHGKNQNRDIFCIEFRLCDAKLYICDVKSLKIHFFIGIIVAWEEKTQA